MKNKAILLSSIALLVVSGCATSTTKQIDRRSLHATLTETNETATIETITKNKSFWDSKNNLNNTKISQTEKTQGVAIGSLSQESSSTNTLNVAERLLETAIKALK